ncbi:unnamed protein product [Cuscuta campestris]|uniref:Uncharacterized protein n=1 Tax=Cuscuta campestris TaxID=132261 RepID=A0A484M002_9ASTE|nr:unnamed protein product [Cuscuta campestris]
MSHFDIFAPTLLQQPVIPLKRHSKTATPQQEDQKQTASEEKFLKFFQIQVQEILTTLCEISNQPESENPERSTENLEKSTPPEATEEEAQEEPAVETLRNFEEAEEGAQIARLEASETPVTILEQQTKDVVTNFHFHSSSTSTFPDEMPESWTKKASFRQDLEKVEMRHSQILEKNEEKYSSNLKEISQSVNKTVEIISLLSNSESNTIMAYASDCHLQLKEAMEIQLQIASVTTSLQKQMSFLQMDIRSALAVSSANQVVTQDYLKILADNQKEAFKLFKHFGTFIAKHKLDVIVQHKSLPPIPKLPIQAKQGEIAYIPTHLNMTELILEAQQSNPENSIQHLSNNEFDGTDELGTFASHFANDAQTKERYNNLKRIKEECGVMQSTGEAVGSSKRKKN